MPDYIRLGIFKGTELVLAITICVLFMLSWALPVVPSLFIYTGLAAFLWVPVILAIGIVAKRPVHVAVNIFCCFIQCVLGVTGAAFIIYEANDSPNDSHRIVGLCGGIFGIMNGALLLIEIATDIIFDVVINRNRDSNPSRERSYSRHSVDSY